MCRIAGDQISSLLLFPFLCKRRMEAKGDRENRSDGKGEKVEAIYSAFQDTSFVQSDKCIKTTMFIVVSVPPLPTSRALCLDNRSLRLCCQATAVRSERRSYKTIKRDPHRFSASFRKKAGEVNDSPCSWGSSRRAAGLPGYPNEMR